MRSRLCRLLDGLGLICAYATYLMTALAVVVVVLRYGFDIGSIALQETVIYLHGYIFMVGASYALIHGGHVRVDVFYRRFSAKRQLWIDRIGHLIFLLPLILFLLWACWDYVLISWRLSERSPEAGGLPFLYVLKTVLLVGPLLLLLALVADLLRPLSAVNEDVRA